MQQEEEQDTAEWYIDRNHYSSINPNPSTSHRTCSIVQDSAPGPAAKVLDATSRVNHAYAKRWSHDYLQFTWVALGSQPWQATVNKPFLLSNLLRARAAKTLADAKKITGGGAEKGKRNLWQGIDTQRNATEVEIVLPTVNNIGRFSLMPYDTVLFLDSNAMIVQLDYDVLDLIAQDKMLAMVGDTSSQIRKSKYLDVTVEFVASPGNERL